MMSGSRFCVPVHGNHLYNMKNLKNWETFKDKNTFYFLTFEVVVVVTWK